MMNARQERIGTIVSPANAAARRAAMTGPPRLGNAVVRSRLDKHFASAAGSVVRVLAPGGYGKSTLIAQWVDDDARPLVWLGLRSTDDHPHLLVDAIVGGLVAAGAVELDEPALLVDRPNSTELLPWFEELVRRSASPFIVVLDDVHAVTRRESSDVIATLATALPADSTLVIAGRCHPHDDAFARLRLDPGVTELALDELAFDLAETEEFMRRAGTALDLQSLEQLATEFEGWPAGLRLAGLALDHVGTDLRHAGTSLARSRFVAEYLEHEWLAGLRADDLPLVMAVACLDRASGELCDEVLAGASSADRLREFGHRSQVLIPIDERDEWYRVPRPLASMLRDRFRDQDRTTFEVVLVRASRWWERRGDIDAAVECALRAGDRERCERMIVEHSCSFLAKGHACSVQRWLDLIGIDRVAASADLQVVAATTRLFDGDAVEATRWLGRVVDPSDGEVLDERAMRIGVMHAILDSRPPAELIGLGAQRRLTGAWRALANWGLGGSYFLRGELQRSRTAFEAGALEARFAGATVVEATLVASAAAVAELQQDERAATAGSREADALVRQDRMMREPTTGIVAATSALVAAREGRRNDAVDSLERTRRLITGFGGVAPALNVLVHLASSRASLRIHDALAASSHLRLAETHLALGRHGDELEPFVEDLRESVGHASAAPSHPSMTLTDAEMRVMAMLPTNLTLADIAARLYVSRNTVKSHVAAIYRKFGTTTRTATVDMARSSGALTDPSTV